MIEINLLPEHLRKKKGKKIQLQNVPIIPLGVGLLGFLFFVYLLVTLIGGCNTRSLKRLNEKWAAMLPRWKEVHALKSEREALEQKIAVIDQLMATRLLWAKKLDELNNLVPAGIWLTSLSLNLPDSLIIKGSVVSRYGDEMASVGKFMRNLEGDKSFFHEFESLELESIQRKRIKEIEVANFTLTCRFKKAQDK